MSKTWVDRHDQDLVNLGQDLFQCGRRRCRINSDSGAFAESPYSVHRAMQVEVAFPMHEKRIRAGFDELGDESIRVRDHQVCLQWKSRHTPQRSNDRRPHRDVRYKMAVHDVDVDPVSSGPLRLAHLRAETGKVCCEDRWRSLSAISIDF